jgi:ABC-type uncharacterized transport system permease subunit
MLSRISIIARQDSSLAVRALTLLAGISIGIALATGLLLLSGVDLKGIINEFILYSFTNTRGLAQTLNKSTALVLIGLASAVALTLRFWNIGIDGQVWLGAIAATGIAIHDVGPPEIRLITMAAAAMAAGALWIGIPVFLKLKLGVNEVITTLMLSYVAFLIAQHLLYGDWRDPSTSFPVTENFGKETERLAGIGFGRVHSGLWLAVGAALVTSYLMLASRFGFYLKAVGLNPRGALSAGMPVTLTLVCAVLLAGGLCGLAGFTVVAGQEFRLTQHVVSNFTFSAILIAFLARFNPVAVVPVSFLVAGLYTAGETLKAFYQLPLATILLVEALILLSIVATEFFAQYRIVLAPRLTAKKA